MKNTPSLTKNQKLVFNVLSEEKGPLSAYSILDDLRDEGFRAPLQVYRALEKLIEMGLVHRLDSMNAFIACCHPNCENHNTSAFTICQECGNVQEIYDQDLIGKISDIAQNTLFQLQGTTVELRGLCKNCR